MDHLWAGGIVILPAAHQAFMENSALITGMDGCGSLRRFDMMQDWLEQVESLRHPETSPLDPVPLTQYI